MLGACMPTAMRSFADRFRPAELLEGRFVSSNTVFASGAMTTQRVVQFGQRGAALRAPTGNALLDVIDLTDFVQPQRPCSTDDPAMLSMPAQRIHRLPQIAEDRR